MSFLSCRRFSPDFFQGCTVEETQLHSLQLYPLFTSQYSIQYEIQNESMSIWVILCGVVCLFLSPGNQSVSVEEPACVFCFFSLPSSGYLYSLKGGVDLLSAYQYPEKVLEAVLTDHLLHVITKYVCSRI